MAQSCASVGAALPEEDLVVRRGQESQVAVLAGHDPANELVQSTGLSSQLGHVGYSEANERVVLACRDKTRRALV